MKEEQLTLRVASDLAVALERAARARGVPKSQVVREALQSYLADSTRPAPAELWDRVQHLVGSVALDPAEVDRDALAKRVRAHNWR